MARFFSFYFACCREWVLLLFFAAAPILFAQTPQATPAIPNSNVKPLSPSEEIQILQAIDAQNKNSGATTFDLSSPVSTAAPAVNLSPSPTPEAIVAAPVGPPPPPTGLSVLVLKEGVYLAWDASSDSSAAASFNVYRSTMPGSGYRQINLKTLTAPYFLDGVPSSISPPKNGENYFYVVAAADSQGRLSDYSDEVFVSPMGMEIPETEEEKAEQSKKRARFRHEEGYGRGA